MYQTHFQLNGFPFANTPDKDLFFPGANRGAVLRALSYAVESGEAIIKVVGEVGSGKTMLCRMLESTLPDTTELVYIANPSLTSETILHAIAMELRLPVDLASAKLEVLHLLQKYLVKKHECKERVVVLVEEAQAMPLDTLEEIRLLSNLETHKSKLIQIVLFGQPELDDKLALPQMRQLKERISYSFNLAPFSKEDVRNYLAHRITSKSVNGLNPFSAQAIQLLSSYSTGLARRVNFLADKTLLAAFSDNSYTVLPKHVRRAARDCEFHTRINFSFMRPMLLGAVVLALVGVSSMGSIMWHQSKESDTSLTVSVVTDVEAAVVASAESPHLQSEFTSPLDQKSFQVKALTVPTVGNSSDVVSQHRYATKDWLASVDEKNYTIQILTSFRDNRNEMKGLEEILADDEIGPWKDQLYIHEGVLGGKKVLVLAYGAFADYAFAKQALKNVPNNLNQYRPLARTIASLQGEIGNGAL